MTWRVIYHHAVLDDLRALGDAQASAVLKVITKRIENSEQRIEHGEPNTLGKPLTGRLAGYRRIRTGSTRVVYRVNVEAVEVRIIATGQRRDPEAYSTARAERMGENLSLRG